MIAVYMRVSTDKQDTNSQEHEIKRFLIERNMSNITWYTDLGISGKTANRPEYLRMCADVHAGRITSVIVYKLDRLGRDAIASMRLLLDWMQAGIGFYSVTQPILQLGPENPFRITIMSIFSELSQVEREGIVQRIKSGLNAAKARGVQLGAKPKYTEHADRIRQLREGGLTLKQIVKQTGIPRTTIHRMLEG